MSSVDRPLAGCRVVDLVSGPLAPITRYLAELGAQVDRIDTGEVADQAEDVAANAGKTRRTFSVDSDAAQTLMRTADIVVATADANVDLLAMRATRPALVTMMASDFGSNTSFTGWQATGPVLHALSGELSRSGIRGHAPLLPPGDLAYQCAAAQAGYVLLVALYRSRTTGEGDHLDFSALDGAVQALDPGFGIAGSATMGKPAHELSRDRPPPGFQYPILPCADGYVRICLLAKRQWRGMFTWMGSPPAFAAPEFDRTDMRYKSTELLPAIAAFFANKTRAGLEAEGQAHGVPISGVLTFAEYLDSDHVAARQGLVATQTPDGGPVCIPNGVVTIDGVRMGPEHCAAGPGHVWPQPESRGAGAHTFTGLKVLDLGVIVVGAEQGRLLADQGADVVKVESHDYPDGNRQSYLSYGLSVSFAAGHRNKQSLGINLRDAKGKQLFLDMAAKADVILSNFKPGTLESLGLGYDAISAINPGIIMIDSSAFGVSGPWSERMGYGPLVRAATGLTLAWRYPGDEIGFSDSVTIYPDHVAARVGAMTAIALMIRRLRTGRGGTASLSQAEVMLAHFGADVARVSMGRETGAPPDWPWSVYQTAGDDEWCVVTVRNSDDWSTLCAAIGYEAGLSLATPAARLAARDAIDRAISSWMAVHTADAAMRTLQDAGVPAARMLRLADLPGFDYFRERDFFRVESHPWLREDVVAERAAVTSQAMPEPPRIPAPLMAENTTEIVHKWLDLPVHEVERLVASGALEAIDPAILAAARQAVARTPA